MSNTTTTTANLTALNRAQYSGLDFDTLEDDLRAQLQVQFASTFNDFSVSSLGILLLDIVAYGLDTLSFYLDRRATDTYLATARTQSSVALLTRQLGYKMAGAIASQVDLQVNPTVAQSVSALVPQRFQFLGPNNIIFETAQPVTLPAFSVVPQTIPCYQGQTVTENFVSDGTPNQVFTLARVPQGAYVVVGSVVVTVNAATWTESQFISFDATNQFEVGYNDAPPTVQFGDSVAGNIPATAASINVTYVATLGEAGQVLSNTITSSATPLVVALQNVPLTINNPLSSVGGSDPETIDHAQVFAPQVFKARQVAVTQGDYEALAGAYADPIAGRVAVAQAIAARSAASDLTLQNLLLSIQSQVAEAIGTVASAGSNGTITAANIDIGTQAATILAAANQLQVDITGSNGLSANLQLIDNNLGALVTGARTIKGNQSEIGVLYTDINADINSINNTINGNGSTIPAIPTAAITLLGTFSVTNSLTSVTATVAQTNVLFPGSIVTFSNYTGTGYTVATVAGTAITLTTAFAGATNATVSATAVYNQLTPATSTALTNTLNALSGLITIIQGLASTSFSSIDSMQGTIAQIQALVEDDIGLTTVAATPETLLEDLQNQVTTIITSIGTTSPEAGILGDVAAIDATIVGWTNEVTTDCAAIAAHVDAFLSADCNANLVVVPILAIDAAGFYAPPSNSLIKSLQAYLDKRKEVTQTVSVTSGAAFLIPVIMTLRIGVVSGVSLSVTQASATTIVDGIMSDRAFGVSLYVSDLVTPLLTITGVAFANVTLMGYRDPITSAVNTSLLDANGNMIISDTQVITLSQAANDFKVNVELFTGSTT